MNVAFPYRDKEKIDFEIDLTDFKGEFLDLNTSTYLTYLTYSISSIFFNLFNVILSVLTS